MAERQVLELLTSKLWNIFVHSDSIELSDYGGFLPNISDIDRMITYLKILKKKGQKGINEHNTKQAKKWKIELPSPPEYIPLKKKGYIYFAEKDGYVKIGRTSQNPQDRIKMLSSQHPNDSGVELLHVIQSEDVVEAEKGFHDFFSEKRVNGEWFHLTDEDIHLIQEVEEI